MLQSYYSKPHQLPLGHCDSFSPGNSAFQTSATLCLKKHEYTQLPYESVFDRCSTISNNELDRNVELSINGISYFNYVEQPNTSRNIQNLSLFAETPPAVQNEEPGSCFSPPFVEGGGLTSFWNGRYPVSVIARRNERERNRVKTINQTFAKLRHHLPSGTGRRRKLSKVQILRLAIQYIHQLQKVLESETDKMEDQKKSDRQREPIENGSLVDVREDFDETSSSLGSSPSPPSQSDSYAHGPFDLALLMDNGMDTERPNNHFEETSGKDVQLDIWKRLSVDAFTVHPEDSIAARPYTNSSEFLM